jgi:hypothetical protein
VPLINIQKKDLRGWKAPDNKPYQPLGEFSNVIQVVEQVKSTIKHSKDLDVET